MHKIPLTIIEREGLEKHGLDIGKPSQLSDVFRHGIAWAEKHLEDRLRAADEEMEVVCEDYAEAIHKLAKAELERDRLRQQLEQIKG